MVRAALILIVGMAFVPLGDSAGKLLVEDHGVAPIFVAWSRFLLGALLILPFLRPAHLGAAYFLDWRLWFRGALISLGVVSILTALQTEPLANVFGAFFSGPILSYVLSVLLLGERVTVARTMLILVGFLGVLLVIRPGFGVTPGLGFAVLAGAFYGAYLVSSRAFAAAAPPQSLLITQLVAGAILMAPFGVTAVPTPSGSVAALVVMSAASSAIGNLLLVLAYARAPATRLAPFIYFQLIAATAYGWGIFGDLPDAVTFAGLGLLVASGFGSLGLRR
ncbi:MAG: DMT family transporter [Pseudomonadota bacterium]